MRVTLKPAGSNPVPSPEALAGERLKQLRTDRKWSQEEVARRMGAYGCDWHQTTVGRTETAVRPLRLNEAVALAALFDVPVTTLIAPPPFSLDDIDEEIGAWEQARERAGKIVEQMQPQLQSLREGLDKGTELSGKLTSVIERADIQLNLLRQIRRTLVSGVEISPDLLVQLTGMHEILRVPELIDAARTLKAEGAAAE